RRDGLLDRWPLGDSLCPLARKACLDLFPEALVGPVLEPGVERHLDVVAAEHRASLRSECEAALRVTVRDFLERRHLGEDAEPAEWVHLLQLGEHARRETLARHAMEAVAAGDEVAVDLGALAALAIAH